MKTDTELLELAALAAGGEFHSGYFSLDGQGWRQWSPLDDDGDAFRLMVKLGLLVDCDSVLSEVEAVLVMHGHDDDYVRMREPYEVDPNAATRRAIVRAAAEIGAKL